MKVFITGETGFIGSRLKNYFQRLGVIVINPNIDIQNSGINNRINILEKEKLNQLEGDIDAIIHLASKTSIPNSFVNPYETYYTNIIGTLNILEFAKEKRIKKVVNVSTYVYGKPLYVPIDENHPINPHSPYNRSKLLAENLCENYSKDFNLNIVTLRPFYIYGPSSNPSSFIPSIIRQINTNRKAILSQKNTKRDFLFVDDFISLVLKILRNFPRHYNVYNVGSGKSNSLEDVIKIFEKIMQNEIDIDYNESLRPNDILEMVADIGIVTEQFDWKPKIDIEEGLRCIIKNCKNTCHFF